jgi:hypothetical protein
MKKLNLRILTMVVATAVITISCNGINKLKESTKEKVKVTVTPKILTEKNGKVDANIRIDIAPEYFIKNATLEARALYVYPDGEILLGSKIVQGEDIEANNMLINSKIGGYFEFNGTIDYKKEMKKGTLELRLIAKIKKKKLTLDYGKIADGIIVSSNIK